jgi:translation initiation factor IF-3
MNLNKELKNNTNKTEKQINNWISQEDVLAIFDGKKSILNIINNKKKISEHEFNKLLDLVVLSLYVLQPPRRIIDYLDMLIVKQLHTDNQHNYLQRFNKMFVFNNYKTAGTYKQIIDEIPDDLMTILDIYFKFHPLKKLMIKGSNSVPFLVKFDGTPLDASNQITRILNKIFDKRVSVSMLRNIYLTDKYSKVMNQMNEDVKAMGTSINTATTNYIKQPHFCTTYVPPFHYSK